MLHSADLNNICRSSRSNVAWTVHHDRRHAVLQHTPSIPLSKDKLWHRRSLLAMQPKPEVWVTRWRSVIGRQASSWTLPLATWDQLQAEGPLHLHEPACSTNFAPGLHVAESRDVFVHRVIQAQLTLLPHCLTVLCLVPAFTASRPWVDTPPPMHCNAMRILSIRIL